MPGQPAHPPPLSRFSTPTYGLVELAARRRLLAADAARHDLRARIVLTSDLGAGQPAQHGELTDMRQGVRDGALKEALGRDGERRVGRQKVVERLQRAKEALDLTVPLERR